MTPTNGLTHYSDERVLIALASLLTGRDQAANPITQADISEEAIVSLRTVHDSLTRLADKGLVIATNRQQGKPAVYSLSDAAWAIAEEPMPPSLVSDPLIDISLLEQTMSSIESLVLTLADILRQQHLSNRIALARMGYGLRSHAQPDRCWACNADREPGSLEDCENCGAGPVPF